MNRRDALKAAVAGLAIPGASSDIVEVKRPFIAVVTHDHKLSTEQISLVQESWRFAIRNTDHPNLPLVIMHGGLKLQIIEDPGGDV